MNWKTVMVLNLTVILMTFFSVPRLSAATYYVSSSVGNDSNSGTSSFPWKSLSKVNSSLFNPGDSILFQRGDVWIGEPLIVSSSGTQGSPITFGAYGNGNLPKIDANNSSSFTNWWTGVLQILGKSWITVENFELTKTQKHIVTLDSSSGKSTGVMIRNCVIHTNGDGYMGIYVENDGPQGSVTNCVLPVSLHEIQ